MKLKLCLDVQMQVTARNNEADIVRGLSSGAVDYCTKPLKRTDFLARVEARLSLARDMAAVSTKVTTPTAGIQIVHATGCHRVTYFAASSCSQCRCCSELGWQRFISWSLGFLHRSYLWHILLHGFAASAGCCCLKGAQWQCFCCQPRHRAVRWRRLCDPGHSAGRATVLRLHVSAGHIVPVHASCEASMQAAWHQLAAGLAIVLCQ